MTIRSEPFVRALVLALAALAGLVLVTVLLGNQHGDAPVQPAAPGAEASREAPSAVAARGGSGLPAADATSSDRPDRPSANPANAPGPPRRIDIAALDVHAAVAPLETEHDVLVPPDDPALVGWWRDGARPGAARGSAVLTGHTVSTGGGVFDDLDRVRPGMPITVTSGNAVLRYEAETVVAYPKQSLAEHAPRVFSQSVPGRLVLVTCEDWNGEVYLSNQVVVARRR